MASKTNTINSNSAIGSGGEFKITFYSTSPNDESKSKYPMQTKTSYKVPDSGDTEINFGKPLSTRPKTRITGFRESRIQDDCKKEATKRKPTSDPSLHDIPSNVVRSRSGRITKKPQRYEPVETVNDDFDENDYDSDDSSGI